MQLDRDGAQLLPGAFAATEVAALRDLFLGQSHSARFGAVAGLRALLGPADAAARRLLGRSARAVAVRFFDKSPAANWALGWHQDRTIAVRERCDAPGFGRWTVKSGIVHCEPPFALLARMLTLRIHLDDVGQANSPLLVAPGSHRLGRLPEAAIAPAVARLGASACLARAGDLWLYSAPILHASERSRAPGRRRVLQLAYSADALPAGLDWLV